MGCEAIQLCVGVFVVVVVEIRARLKTVVCYLCVVTFHFVVFECLCVCK